MNIIFLITIFEKVQFLSLHIGINFLDNQSTVSYSTTYTHREKGDFSKKIYHINFLAKLIVFIQKVPYVIRIPEIRPVPIIMKEFHPYPIERKVTTKEFVVCTEANVECLAIFQCSLLLYKYFRFQFQ